MAMRAAFEALRERLQRLWKSGPAGAGKQLQEEQRSREVWQQCRVLASELGEAQAAYARRSAEEKCTGKEVVDELKAELKALREKERLFFRVGCDEARGMECAEAGASVGRS